jgi:hypothetical protein
MNSVCLLAGYFKSLTELDADLAGGQEGVISVPDEMDFFQPLGLDRYLVLKPDDRFHMNWAAFGVALLGIIQIAAGVALCIVGMPNFGNALISEGVSDLVQGVMGMITGQFSLADWALQKVVSLAISLLTAGISAAKAASTVGTLTKVQKFTKAIIRVGIDIAAAAIGEVIPLQRA